MLSLTNKSNVSLFLIASLLWLSPSHGFEKDFPPYPDNKLPPTCSINTLKASNETDRNKGSFKSTYRLIDQSESLILHVDMDYSKKHSGVYARLNNTSGKALLKPLKVGSHPSNIKSIYWAYLNKDNHKDWIIVMDGGDGYLSAGRQTVSFLLSSKNGYQQQQLSAYSVGQKDFYDYSTDSKCEYLHQTLVSDSSGSYWAYNVLQFIDGKIVIKNQLSCYFPKWIKLTVKPNSKASTLSKKQIKAFSKGYKERLKQVE